MKNVKLLRLFALVFSLLLVSQQALAATCQTCSPGEDPPAPTDPEQPTFDFNVSPSSGAGPGQTRTLMGFYGVKPYSYSIVGISPYNSAMKGSISGSIYSAPTTIDKDYNVTVRVTDSSGATRDRVIHLHRKALTVDLTDGSSRTCNDQTSQCYTSGFYYQSVWANHYCSETLHVDYCRYLWAYITGGSYSGQKRLEVIKVSTLGQDNVPSHNWGGWQVDPTYPNYSWGWPSTVLLMSNGDHNLRLLQVQYAQPPFVPGNDNVTITFEVSDADGTKVRFVVNKHL